MARQHRELQVRLEDAEKLQLYAGSAASKHRDLEESLSKAKSWSRHWEQKAKEGTERTTGAEKEREEAKEEAQVFRITAIVVGDAKAKVEGDLVSVQDALAAAEEAMVVAEEAKHKVEAKALT